MKDLKNKGWVRLHRQIEDSVLWFLEPFTKAQAWIDLFLNANHKDNIIQIRGNIIPIKRGQIGWSELTMVKRWKWSKNRVRHFLKLLETEQQIIQQKERYITTIITIINYEKYQNDTANDTAERQQKDSRRYINKNDKNDKNDKNIVPNGTKELVNHFFVLKGWDNKDKDFYSKNKIVYARHARPAKQLLELCDQNLEEAKICLQKIKDWADSRQLDWSIETVFKKWYELDLLKPKEKKPYFENKRIFQKVAGGRWYCISFDGNTRELGLTPKKEEIVWK